MAHPVLVPCGNGNGNNENEKYPHDNDPIRGADLRTIFFILRLRSGGGL